MIAGIGIDLVEVERMRNSFKKFGDRFLNRFLLPEETSYCLTHKEPSPFIAARFAAKEAIAKAFGVGIGSHLAWHSIEIKRRENGEPFVALHGAGAALLASRGGGRLHLSISHTHTHATAMAILETP